MEQGTVNTSEVLRGLDLFSGVGGIALALEPWVRPIAYCEIDSYCQGVLLSRMRGGLLPKAPIWDDVRTLQSSEFEVGTVDIIYGGFPCQDISVAAPIPKGLAGERSGLFREIVRLGDEIRPQFIFLENVPAITSRGLGEVTAALSRIRYDCRWGMLSAYDVGAPHLRQRWFLLAHSNRERCEANEKSDRKPIAWGKGKSGNDSHGFRDTLSNSNCEPIRNDKQWTPRGWNQISNSREAITRDDGSTESLAHTARVGSAARARRRKEPKASSENPFAKDWWATEPGVGRVAHGIPKRVDRIRAMGNAVVPLQAREAFQRLMFGTTHRSALI